ncbi:exodeoxyribonuclease VII small subunit [Parapedobacter sp.]
MDKPYTYTDAFEELQTIVSEIEHGEISVDELSEKVKRATQLIHACKAKLTTTEAEVNNILAGLADDDVGPAKEG